MCNLYRMTRAADEVARLFGVDFPAPGNAAAEVYPGYPAYVVAQDQLRTMHWGFPLALRGKQGQLLKPRPVNNARSDKLSGLFWQASFAERRCLIPMSAWAEAQGRPGHKTRSWLSIPGGELCAAAGLWRWSEEWGEVFSMVMVDAGPGMGDLHTRMPALITPEERATYLQGAPQAALALCRPYPGALEIAHSDEPWAGKSAGAG